MTNSQMTGLTVQNSFNPPVFSGVQGCMNPFACKLKVEGKGSIIVQPDMAVVVLGVTTENKQLQPAQEENAQRITSVLNTLKRLGVDSRDVETHSYIIEPQYDYTEGKQVFRGYRVVHTLKVTIRNVERVGAIIDAAVESGANLVNSISFAVEEPSRYYQQALRSAIDDAQSKALIIGDKLKINISLIPAQMMEVNYRQEGPMVLSLSTAGEAATPIKAGQIEVTAQIEAIFNYTPNYRKES